MRRALARLAAGAGLAALWLAGCAAAPQRYAPDPALPVARVDDGGFDGLLRAHVRDGQVDYPRFCGDAAFRDFRAQLANAELPDDLPQPERLAFWINAYNALSVAGILDGGSPESLWGRYRFFLRTRHPLAGERITLWDLEQARIRKLGEPRIHFALVCASSSCPRLRPAAYTAAELDAELDEVTRAFVNDPTRNRFDPEARVAHLSRIFKWYAEDFTAEADSIAAWIAPWVADAAVASDLAAGRYAVRWLDYDWSLNGPPPPEGCDGGAPAPR